MSEVGLSIVVMAFDEAASLETVIGELEAAVKPLGHPYQILIVDDGSGDRTGEIADRLAEERAAVEVIHHASNRGLGAVYRTGLFESRGRFVTFFPADGQFLPSSIAKLMPFTDEHDLVLGFLPQRRRSPVGAVLSRLERSLSFLLLGSTPRFQGVFLLRRDVLDAFPLESRGRGWGIVMELILKAQRAGFRIVSVPTEVRPRMAGHSKVQNLRTIRSNVVQLFQVRSILRQ